MILADLRVSPLFFSYSLRRLALVSGSFAKEGFYPEMIVAQAQLTSKMAKDMKDTPMSKSYVALAPSPGDFPKLLDSMGDLMKKPFDWFADAPKLTMPVMLVCGDSDMYRQEHVVKFYQLLGGGLKDAGGSGRTCRATAWSSCRV